MNSNELIKVNFNGIQRHIIAGKTFKDFKKQIKKCFNFTNNEYSRLSFSYKINENIENIITTEKDFKNYIHDMIYSNEPEKILINIKPIVQSLKYDELGNQIYTLKYYNDLNEYNKQLLNKIEQLNNYKNILNDDLKKLEKINKSIIATIDKKESIIDNDNIKSDNDSHNEEIDIKTKKIFKCRFLNKENEKIISIKKSLIHSQYKIKYKFKVENLGEEWPNDTYIKCEENEDIDFEKVGLGDCSSKDIFNSKGEFFHEFEVKIFFKDYNNIQIKKYELKAYLESLDNGVFEMENGYGNLIINIIDDKEIISIFNDEI